MLGWTEILIIVGVVLILFGGSAIPKFARSLGRAKKEFEEGLKEGAQAAQKESTDKPADKKE